MALDHLITARTAALFASDLPNQCRPSQAVVEAAIDGTLTACGGVDGCVGALAAAYGDHPETAAPRMKSGPADHRCDAICRSAEVSGRGWVRAGGARW